MRPRDTLNATRGGPGAVLGAVIGSGVALQSNGDELLLPAGQRVRVRLSAPVTVSYKPHTEKQAKSE